MPETLTPTTTGTPRPSATLRNTLTLTSRSPRLTARNLDALRRGHRRADRILILYMAAISWVAAAIGLLTRFPEAAGNATFIIMFLPYLSGAFVPISSMPY